VYVILKSQSDDSTCKISQKLAFTITEIDVETEEEVGSYEEDYEFPDVQIAVRDYIHVEALAQG
jgi:UDP-glucose 4-epimerase